MPWMASSQPKSYYYSTESESTQSRPLQHLQHPQLRTPAMAEPESTSSQPVSTGITIASYLL